MPELQQRRPIDLWIAPLCEAGLIFVAALSAWLLHRPMMFASLGPTAYELIETPERATAHPYNILVGHLIGILSGFFAIYVTHAWSTAPVTFTEISFPRVLATTLAALLTVFGTLLARATQPAAVSTSLVISMGSMQRPWDGPFMMLAILLLTLIGEPLRRLRSRKG
jgi:CBS domain-containing membrane protein